ncbi:cytochrome b/b6 domain-containing protein [Colwellia sp. MEBiC06753]
MSDSRNAVKVWSRKIRLFHWLNVTAITLLIVIGVVILNASSFGVSTEGKILLKTLHVLVGYIFAANLVFRLILAFVGKGYERWREMLPFTRGYTQQLSAFKRHETSAYKGHNPAGKLMVAALLLLMTVQMVSGLVLAGTDIYYPPLGNYFAERVAIDKSKLADIKPYSKSNIDQEAYKEVRAMRAPFMSAHIFSFYGLLLLIPLHIIGVIVAERREKSALVSSMINGYKYLPDDKSPNQE